MVVPTNVSTTIPFLILHSFKKLALPHLWGFYAVLGGPLVLFGILTFVFSALTFAQAGRGTPIPWDAPKDFVAVGLYRFVRNPMYLGVLSVVLGWALIFCAPILLGYLFTLWLFFHLFILIYEEPTLRRRFGDSYREYCRGVPRWIPRETPARRRPKP